MKALPYFTGTSVSSINLGGVFISPQVLWVVGISAIMVALLTVFFNYTLLGRQMRACSANRDAARLCGINAQNMVTLSFVLSAGIGALGGCIVSPITYTQYDIGTPLAIKGFTVAILGGLGNSTAAVATGMILGTLESFSIWVLPAAFKDVISIAILLVHYVPKLEYGSSRQAPHGMVRVSLREISNVLAGAVQSAIARGIVEEGKVREGLVEAVNMSADFGMGLIRDRTPIRTGRARRGWHTREAQ